MSLPTYVAPHITQVFQQYTTYNLRSIALGCGLAYAWPNGFWHHTPLVIMNPLAYGSYQLFVSKNEVIKYCKELGPPSKPNLL